MLSEHFRLSITPLFSMSIYATRSKVILFGSYAYGTPDLDSDVDLLVVMDSDESMAQRIRRVTEVAKVRFLPMDIIVRTPTEMVERLAIGDFFLAEILEKGKVLYRRESAC